MSAGASPKGFVHIEDAVEVLREQGEARRWSHDPDCPQARPEAGTRATAVRCYHDGCGHLFDPALSSNEVLCPCCA